MINNNVGVSEADEDGASPNELGESDILYPIQTCDDILQTNFNETQKQGRPMMGSSSLTKDAGDERLELVSADSPSHSSSPSQQQSWPVKAILGERNNKYLLAWYGRDPETGKPWEPTWETKSNLTCPALVREWNRNGAARQNNHDDHDDHRNPGFSQHEVASQDILQRSFSLPQFSSTTSSEVVALKTHRAVPCLRDWTASDSEVSFSTPLITANINPLPSSSPAQSTSSSNSYSQSSLFRPLSNTSPETQVKRAKRAKSAAKSSNNAAGVSEKHRRRISEPFIVHDDGDYSESQSSIIECQSYDQENVSLMNALDVSTDSFGVNSNDSSVSILVPDSQTPRTERSISVLESDTPEVEIVTETYKSCDDVALYSESEASSQEVYPVLPSVASLIRQTETLRHRQQTSSSSRVHCSSKRPIDHGSNSQNSCHSSQSFDGRSLSTSFIESNDPQHCVPITEIVRSKSASVRLETRVPVKIHHRQTQGGSTKSIHHRPLRPVPIPNPSDFTPLSSQLDPIQNWDPSSVSSVLIPAVSHHRRRQSNLGSSSSIEKGLQSIRTRVDASPRLSFMSGNGQIVHAQLVDTHLWPRSLQSRGQSGTVPTSIPKEVVREEQFWRQGESLIEGVADGGIVAQSISSRVLSFPRLLRPVNDWRPCEAEGLMNLTQPSFTTMPRPHVSSVLDMSAEPPMDMEETSFENEQSQSDYANGDHTNETTTPVNESSVESAYNQQAAASTRQQNDSAPSQSQSQSNGSSSIDYQSVGSHGHFPTGDNSSSSLTPFLNLGKPSTSVDSQPPPVASSLITPISYNIKAKRDLSPTLDSEEDEDETISKRARLEPLSTVVIAANTESKPIVAETASAEAAVTSPKAIVTSPIATGAMQIVNVPEATVGVPSTPLLESSTQAQSTQTPSIQAPLTQAPLTREPLDSSDRVDRVLFNPLPPTSSLPPHSAPVDTLRENATVETVPQPSFTDSPAFHRVAQFTSEPTITSPAGSVQRLPSPPNSEKPSIPRAIPPAVALRLGSPAPGAGGAVGSNVDSLIALIRSSSLIVDDSVKEEIVKFLTSPASYAAGSNPLLLLKPVWAFEIRRNTAADGSEKVDFIIVNPEKGTYQLKRLPLNAVANIDFAKTLTHSSRSGSTRPSTPAPVNAVLSADALSELTAATPPPPTIVPPALMTREQVDAEVTLLRSRLISAESELNSLRTLPNEVSKLKAEIDSLTKKNRSLTSSKETAQSDFQYMQAQYQEASNAAVARAQEAVAAEAEATTLKVLLDTGLKQRELFQEGESKRLNEHLSRLKLEVKLLKEESQRTQESAIRTKASLWDSHLARLTLEKESDEDDALEASNAPFDSLKDVPRITGDDDPPRIAPR